MVQNQHNPSNDRGSVRPGGRTRCHGLTLLELLLVVFILSLVAVSAVSLTGGVDQQFRYDQTRTRLADLRQAVVGNAWAGPDRSQALFGYVADVGALPERIDVLVNDPTGETGMEPFALRPPVFDPDDGQSGDETQLDEDDKNLWLPKGWRGPYVPVEPAGGDRLVLRDAWGTVNPDPAADRADHGWLVETLPESMTITSLGRNGEADATSAPDAPDAPADVYDGDLTLDIEAADWRVDPAFWRVTVTNTTGLAVADARAALLVYEAGQWRTLMTGAATVPAGETVELTFPDDADAVPVGDHLLILATGSGDAATLYGSAGDRAAQRVRFTARTSRPDGELTIR